MPMEKRDTWQVTPPPDDLLVGPSWPIDIAADEEAVFSEAWSALGHGECLPEELVRWRFLCWATDYRGVFAHGSNNRGIQRFDPRPQTDWFGRVVNAVFAAKDGIYPMYFAIVDRLRH